MSRRDGFSSPNNGLAPNARPRDQRLDTQPDYRPDPRRYMDSPGRPLPLPTISSVVSRGGQAFYQAAPDVRNFPPAAMSSAGPRQPAYSPPQPRPQISPPGQYRKWGPPQQLTSPTQGSNRNPLSLNSVSAHPNISSHNQLANPQMQNHPSRRQGPGPRPQVRLPNLHQGNQPVNGSHPAMYGHRNITPPEANSNLKSRTSSTASEYKDVQPKDTLRRHRPSISNSSKTSISSSSWEPSTQSSFTDPSHHDQNPQKSPSTTTPTAEDLDKEWLLLREQAAKAPPPVDTDKYAHIPPLVRKWASVTIPEVRMGEPTWATSVLSRKWEKEESWEKEKKELLAQKEQLGDDAPTPFRRITCMTREQDRANRVAELALAMLHDDMDDRDTTAKNIDDEGNTPVEAKAESVIV